MEIEELPLPDCQKLMEQLGCKYSPYEFFKLLGVTGGILRYLEEIKRRLLADENIKKIDSSIESLINYFQIFFRPTKKHAKKLLLF